MPTERAGIATLSQSAMKSFVRQNPGRRRCRRDLHRCLLARRKDRAVRHRQGPVGQRRHRERIPAGDFHVGRRAARDRVGRPRHHRRHQRAARTQGGAHRADRNARLPRRAGDAPARPAQYLGPVGQLPPGGDPGPRHRGGRARARRRNGPEAGRRGRGDPRRTGAARTRLRGARHRLHQRLCQRRQRTRRA